MTHYIAAETDLVYEGSYVPCRGLKVYDYAYHPIDDRYTVLVGHNDAVHVRVLRNVRHESLRPVPKLTVVK